MQSPHHLLVNGEGPLVDGVDGCQAGGVVLAKQGGDGDGHLLTLEHLALQHQDCSDRVGTLSLKKKGKIISIQNFGDENVLDLKQKVVTCLYLPLLHVSLHVVRITM